MPMPILPRPINPTVSILSPHRQRQGAHSNSAPNVAQGVAPSLLVETTLQATQVGNLAKVLVFFTDQLAEHAANSKIVRQGTSAAHFRKRDALRMDVEFAGIHAM